ncbi:hypothetical protein LGM14_18365 [Burkholderia multivorans]|nr:hypothetical protein [Burkholderia multivorans]
MSEQPKNQQPAAAPIDIEARFIAEHGHRLAQLLRIDAFDIADRDAQIMAALKGEHAPAPADERAAYHFHRFVDGVEMAEGVLIERAPTLEAAIKEAVRCCEKRPMTVLVHAPAWAGTLCGGALANRAASANETGAEGAEPMAVPAGWKLVRVNEHFDALIAALERAESKGYLPDSMREEWENFACDENVTAPTSDQGEKS